MAYEATVIVCGPGRLHATQCHSLDAGHETAFADQPVGGIRGLLLDPLLAHDPEYVRDMLVQGAGLVLVVEWAGVLSNGVLGKKSFC